MVNNDSNSIEKRFSFFDQRITYEVINVNMISINTESINVSVLLHESENIFIHFYGKACTNGKIDFQTSLNTQHHLLEIKSSCTGTLFSNTLTLKVYLPRRFFGNLSISSSSGNISLDKIQTNLLNLRTSSGNLKVNDCIFSDVTVDTFSGNVNFVVHIKNNVSFNVTSTTGNITLKLPNAGLLNFVITSNNVVKKALKMPRLGYIASGKLTTETGHITI